MTDRDRKRQKWQLIFVSHDARHCSGQFTFFFYIIPWAWRLKSWFNRRERRDPERDQNVLNFVRRIFLVPRDTREHHPLLPAENTFYPGQQGQSGTLFIPCCLTGYNFIPQVHFGIHSCPPLGLKERVPPLWANGMAFSESSHQFTPTALISLEAPPSQLLSPTHTHCLQPGFVSKVGFSHKEAYSPRSMMLSGQLKSHRKAVLLSLVSVSSYPCLGRKW